MKIKIILLILFLSICSYGAYLFTENEKLKKENTTHIANMEGLMTGIDNLTLENGQKAVQVSELRLTVGELESYRSADAEKIKEMGIKLKNLQALAKHSMQVKIPISAKIEEPLNIEDQDTAKFYGIISINNPYLQVDGAIDGDSINLEVTTQVKLDQVIHTIPKHKFLWWSWGVKGVKQVITTDNPYVNIEYSEFITIEKTR